MDDSSAAPRPLWRRVGDALRAVALRFGLGPTASLLPVIVWVAALIGALHATLLFVHAALRLFGLVGLIAGSALLAVAAIGALTG